MIITGVYSKENENLLEIVMALNNQFAGLGFVSDFSKRTLQETAFVTLPRALRSTATVLAVKLITNHDEPNYLV